jgi:hypothetical protein
MKSDRATLARALGAALVFSSSVTAIPSYACEGLLPKPVEWKPNPGEVKLFEVNGRTVRVTIPENYNQSTPSSMVVAFHDREQPKEHLEYDGAFFNEEINPNAIMVFPSAEEVR